MSQTSAARLDARAAFVQQRVRAGVPWTVALTELLLLLDWRGGLSGAALAWHAAATVVATALAYLPIAVGLARLEWRYSPLTGRNAP